MVFGKSEEAKERERRKRENERQRAQQIAMQGMSQADGATGGEALRQLSEIDDLSNLPGDTMDQFISKVTSTSNLTEEDVESSHWVRQYVKILYLSRFPTREGLSGHARAYAYGSRDEYRTPLDESDLANLEAFTHMSGLATSRSEDFKVGEESLRTIAESHVKNEDLEDTGGDGLLGKVGLK